MDTTIGGICDERDNQELLLMRKALAIDGFPVFGICHGCQLLNVALGGSLIMDIDTKESDEHFFLINVCQC